jgi:RNA polymerase sigma factor (sigma-70 family)
MPRKRGNELAQLTDAQRELVERYGGLVVMVTKQYRALKHDDYRDLQGHLWLRLAKCALTWQPERGVKFPSYATKCMQADAKNWFRDYGYVVRPPQALRQDICDKLFDADKVEELGETVGVERVVTLLSCAVPISLDGNEFADDFDPKHQALTTQDEAGEVVEGLYDSWIMEELEDALEPAEFHHLSLRLDGQKGREAAKALGVSGQEEAAMWLLLQAQVSEVLEWCREEAEREPGERRATTEDNADCVFSRGDVLSRSAQSEREFFVSP